MDNLLDLAEYNQGQDGFGPDLLETLRYPGSRTQFYENVLGILTEHVARHLDEIDPDREFVINMPFDLSDAQIYAVLVLDVRENGLYRFLGIPVCSISLGDEEFDIADDLESYYVKNLVQNPGRKFRSDYDTSLTAIAKKIRH